MEIINYYCSGVGVAPTKLGRAGERGRRGKQCLPAKMLVQMLRDFLVEITSHPRNGAKLKA